jgi:hypothetical protein
MLAGVQAGDMADRSRQGFLSKADAAEALYDYYKFITPNVAPVAQHSRAAQQTAGREEEKAAQKEFTNDSSMGLPAIGIGLVSLAAMLGFGHLRRGAQSATDLSAPLVSQFEPEAQGSPMRCDPKHGRVAMLAASMFTRKEGDFGFDPLNLYPAEAAKEMGLKSKELKNAGLAMFACAGMSASPAYAADATDVGQAFHTASNILVAANEGDFGGYFFPAFGLGLLAAIIVFLAPPLADE